MPQAPVAQSKQSVITFFLETLPFAVNVYLLTEILSNLSAQKGGLLSIATELYASRNWSIRYRFAKDREQKKGQEVVDDLLPYARSASVTFSEQDIQCEITWLSTEMVVYEASFGIFCDSIEVFKGSP